MTQTAILLALPTQKGLTLLWALHEIPNSNVHRQDQHQEPFLQCRLDNAFSQQLLLQRIQPVALLCHAFNQKLFSKWKIEERKWLTANGLLTKDKLTASPSVKCAQREESGPAAGSKNLLMQCQHCTLQQCKLDNTVSQRLLSHPLSIPSAKRAERAEWGLAAGTGKWGVP